MPDCNRMIDADGGSTPVSVLLWEKGADQTKARQVAEQLGLFVTDDPDEAAKSKVYLLMNGRGLALTDGNMEYRGDYAELLPRLKPGRLQGELLVKAAKIKNPEEALTAVDATAGLGEDALLLAASGFQVLLCEQDPIIAALLADTIERASYIEELSGFVKNMTWKQCNSIDELKTLSFVPNVVYLDPMFPARRKSGLIKKKFQLLHHLEAPCANAEELMMAALAVSPRKIVIKRPLKAENLAGVKPGYSIKGKSIRYDCIVPSSK